MMLRPKSSFSPENMPVLSIQPKQLDMGFKSLQYSRSERNMHTNRLIQSQNILTERLGNSHIKLSKNKNFGMNTRNNNSGPFYKNKMTVINEEDELFPDNSLTLFDNSGTQSILSFLIQK